MKITPKQVLIPLFFNLFMMAAACAAEQSPPDTPPQINNLEEDEPTVTQRKKEHVQQTTQTIQNGPQTEVRVTNDIGTYIVKPNQTVGDSMPGDAQSSSNHAVQWVIKSWGNRRERDPTATPPDAQNSPDNVNPE